MSGNRQQLRTPRAFPRGFLAGEDVHRRDGPSGQGQQNGVLHNILRLPGLRNGLFWASANSLLQLKPFGARLSATRSQTHPVGSAKVGGTPREGGALPTLVDSPSESLETGLSVRMEAVTATAPKPATLCPPSLPPPHTPPYLAPHPAPPPHSPPSMASRESTQSLISHQHTEIQEYRRRETAHRPLVSSTVSGAPHRPGDFLKPHSIFFHLSHL